MNSYKAQSIRRFERILITGAGGFTGQFLSGYIRTQIEGIQVFGLDINPELQTDTQILQADITERERLEEIINQVRPECVIHLASFFNSESLDRLYQVNVVGTVNLLESLLQTRLSPQPVVVIVGSSAKYGAASNTGMPITENTPSRPVSHYGITKAAQELIGLRYYLSREMQIIQACPFNLVGPGQSEDFLCGSIVKQIEEARQAKIPPVLRLGNLSPRRDYVDVRDAVRAYWSLAESGEFGEVYNVCSGKAYSADEVLDLVSEIAEIELEIQQVDAKRREADIPLQVGDYGKLHAATDWKPSLSLRDSLRDMMGLSTEGA